MSETWPSNIIAYRCDFRLRANTTVFRSPITRSAQRLKRQGQLWVAEYAFRQGREKDQPLEGILLKLEGAYGDVLMWDHAHPTPLGTNLDRSSITGLSYFSSGSPSVLTGFSSGSPSIITAFYGGAAGITVINAWVAGATSITARGFPGSSTQLLAADKFGIGGYLYALTDDADADSLGHATLNFRPPLRAAAAHGAVITRTRPTVRMQLVDDDQGGRPVDYDRAYERTLSLVEVLDVP